MRLADFVMAHVRAQGVRHVFLVPGGGAMYLVDALGQCEGLTPIPNLHEQASGIAAEAYARINERLGVALVTTGPGSTNAVTAVAGAWIESVPMLVISGQVKRADLKGESGVRQMGVQEVDIVSIVAPITKYAVTISDPASIRFHLEKALALATSGRQGPVWIDIPLDVQASQIEPARLQGYAAEAESAPTIDAELDRIVDLLQTAERPLLLAGHGIRLSGAAAAFAHLYETLQVPVVTTWNAMDLIPFAHPLAVGKPGVVALRAPNFAVQNCDLLIAIGSRLDNIVTAYAPERFARAAKRVVCDVDAAELAKLRMPIDVRVCADARRVIDGLRARADRVTTRWQSWIERCQLWKERYPVMDGKPFASEGPLSHFHLASLLSELIPEHTLVATGSSGLGLEAFYTAFANRTGQRVFLTSGLGAMGYGLPAAIGACCANDKRPMVLIESDGSLLFNIQELCTIKAQDLPLRILVMNNQGYASIRSTQRNYFSGRYVGTGPEAGLLIPDLCKVAESMGIKAVRVTGVRDARTTLREVLHMRGPVLCDIATQPDESLWPKSAAIPQADGSMISMPLEDMTPLLPLAELEENMIVPIQSQSRQARGLA